MSWLLRFIPSRAAIWGVLAAIGGFFILWLRRDAKEDVRKELKEKDWENAKEIRDRVDRVNGVRPNNTHNYRD